MAFFVVLLLVLGLRHVLVALDQLGPGPRFVERRSARVLGADRALRQQPLEVWPLHDGQAGVSPVRTSCSNS